MTKPKRKMQDVSFRNIEEMLDYLPDNEREMIEHLRMIIKDCIPQVKEKLAYNVPFYRQRKNICYLWPGAIPWGKSTFQGVIFGLIQGHQLTDPMNYLEVGKRKYVRTKRFTSIQDIDEDLIKLFLFEAHALDQSAD